jgi:hypothetical protein
MDIQLRLYERILIAQHLLRHLGEQEAGVLHRAVQAGDRPGLRGDPRDAPPAPAQEARARGAASARRKNRKLCSSNSLLFLDFFSGFGVSCADSLFLESRLLYPGLCLADVTPGSYKIEEVRALIFFLFKPFQLVRL